MGKKKSLLVFWPIQISLIFWLLPFLQPGKCYIRISIYMCLSIIWRPKERSAYTFLNFTFWIQRKVSHHNILSFWNKLQENQILKFFCLKKKKNLSTISQPHSLPFLKNSRFQRNRGIFWLLFHSVFV